MLGGQAQARCSRSRLQGRVQRLCAQPAAAAILNRGVACSAPAPTRQTGGLGPAVGPRKLSSVLLKARPLHLASCRQVKLD